jgi:molybdate transport system substrate-binding protein
VKQITITFMMFLHVLVAGEISIAVAANVSYAIHPLIKAFNETHPKTTVHVILGSSGKLFAQISHSAPYDLFMSANMKYPNRLYKDNLTTEKPIIYARGSLAILSQKKRDYCADIFVLKNPDIKKIAIANPHTAPYGVAAVEALKHANLYRKLEKKFVYGESISQTVIYTISAADIGIIAKSSLYAPQMAKYKEAIHWTEIDGSLYTPIEQGMVMLKKSEKNMDVKAFYDFIQSKKAKKILTSFGYKVS